MIPVSVADAGFVKFTAPSSEIVASARFGGERMEWNGELIRSENRIDPQSRSITMVAEFSGEDGPSVGLIADFEITGKQLEQVFVLPRTALVGANRVIVIDDEDKIVFREIRVARTTQNEAYVSKGLEVGDRVCVTVLNRPIAGTLVQVVNPEE